MMLSNKCATTFYALKLGSFGGLQLQLELVSDQRDKFGIGGFSLGIGNCIAKESLQSVKISTIPSHFNGMADGSFYTAGGGLEGLGHLRIKHLGDGVDGVPTAHLTATAATGFVDDL
jgi:hypothetical protein